MDLEEFCVQAAGKVKGRVTFQGHPVRLDPKLSVCRQLHHRWLSATGREVSYEDFKRSLRFRMQNGEVAVRMAYDPTKLLVAGLAGVGATVSAVGAYQWWKSRKGGEAKQELTQCAEPDYSKWENAESFKTQNLSTSVWKKSDAYKYSTCTAYVNGFLKDDVPIGEQVCQILQRGFPWVENDIEREWYNCKQEPIKEYTVRSFNQAIEVLFENPLKIKRAEFDFNPVNITVDVKNDTVKPRRIDKLKYNIACVHFNTDKTAIMHNAHWVLRMGEPNREIFKKVPNDDLSILCAIPTKVLYVREGVDFFDKQ